MSTLSDAEARFTAAKERLLSLIKSSVDRTEGGSSLEPYNSAGSEDPSLHDPSFSMTINHNNNSGQVNGLSSLQQLAQDFHATSGRDEKSRTSSNRRSGGGGGEASHAILASEMRQLAAALPLLQPVNPHHHPHHSISRGGLSTAPHSGNLPRDRSTSDGSAGAGSDAESNNGGGGSASIIKRTSSGLPSGNSKKRGKGKGSASTSNATSSATAGTAARTAPKDFDLRLGPAYQADIDKMREKSEQEWEKRRQEAHSRMQMLSLSRDGKSFHIHPPTQTNFTSTLSSTATFSNTHHHGISSARTSRSRGGSNSKNSEDTSSGSYASYSTHRTGASSSSSGSTPLHLLPSTPMGTSSSSGSFGTFAFPAALTSINVASSSKHAAAAVDKASSSSASAILFSQRQQSGVAFMQSSASSSSLTAGGASTETSEKFTPSMTLNTPSFPPSLVMPHINLSIRSSQKSSTNNPASAPHSPTIPSPTLAQQQYYQSQQASLFEQQQNAFQRLYHSNGGVGDTSRSTSPASALTKSSHGDSPERLEELTRAVQAQQVMMQQMLIQQQQQQQSFSSLSLQEGQPLWSQPMQPNFHQYQQQHVLPSLYHQQQQQQQQQQQEVRDPRSVRMQIDSALAHSKPFLPPPPSSSSSARTSPTKELSPAFSLADSMLKPQTDSGGMNYAANNPLKVGVATPKASTSPITFSHAKGMQPLSPPSSLAPPGTLIKIESINSLREGSPFVIPPTLLLSSKTVSEATSTSSPALSPRSQIEVKYGLSVYDSHRAALSSSTSTTTSFSLTAPSSPREDLTSFSTREFSKYLSSSSSIAQDGTIEAKSGIVVSDTTAPPRVLSKLEKNAEDQQQQLTLQLSITEGKANPFISGGPSEEKHLVDTVDLEPSNAVINRDIGGKQEEKDKDTITDGEFVNSSLSVERPVDVDSELLLLPLSPIQPSAVKARDFSAVTATPLSQQPEDGAFNSVDSALKNVGATPGGVDLNYSNVSPNGLGSSSMVGVGGGLDDYVEEMRKQLLRQQMFARGIINSPPEVDDLDGEEDEDVLGEDDEGVDEQHGEESFEELRSELLAAQAEVQMKTSPVMAT